MIYVIVANTVLLVILFVLVYSNKSENEQDRLRNDLSKRLSTLESGIKDDFQRNRSESHLSDQRSRTELNDTLRNALEDFRNAFERNVKSFNELQREKFANLENRQNELVLHTEEKLERIRGIVEEKLEKTLSERLKQSFSSVSTQLTEVQKGLGEMRNLATDVGGLKRVLSNVKMRGGVGEIQLSLLLEQLLSPEQYAVNVRTKRGSNDPVEFAIRLPDKETDNQFIWLPIDAKFPKDVFEKMQDAYDKADPAELETSRRLLISVIKKMARDISDKYIDPPYTTDFAIMFLPFEGIFSEVVRNAGLLEELQRDYKIIVTGPTTLGAILNSLQMGFKTLAIQKRSSEVWQILAGVKKEFGEFGNLLGKAQHNIQTGLNQLDDVMGKRTRAIQRKLRGVQELPSPESNTPGVLPPDENDDPEMRENDQT